MEKRTPPRSLEEGVKDCWMLGHQAPFDGLCRPCVQAYAAEQTAALQETHEKYVRDMEAVDLAFSEHMNAKVAALEAENAELRNRLNVPS